MHKSFSIISDASELRSCGESIIGVDIELDVIDAAIEIDGDEPDVSLQPIVFIQPSIASSLAISSMTNCKLSSLGIVCVVVKKS